MKILKAILVNETFNSGFKKLAQLPMSFKDGYALSKTARQLEAEMQAFEEARSAIIRKYGKQTGDGKGFEIPVEDEANMAKFRSDLVDYAQQQFDVFLDHPIRLKPAEVDASGVKFTVAELSLLRDFIEVE